MFMFISESNLKAFCIEGINLAYYVVLGLPKCSDTKYKIKEQEKILF